MTKRKFIISLLLFLLYEVLVVVGCRYLVSEDNFLLAVVFLSALGLTIFIVYILVSRLTRHVGAGGASAPPPAGGAGAAGQQAAPPPPQVSASGPDPEIDAVLGLISEANTRLAQSPTLSSRRIRTSVTSLPMYLLVGPEGSGKTATFLGAGLEPELLAGQVYRDSVVLPTKLCNFWYAGEAAFVETAGTFFSQEPGRWMRLLKHLRGKKPGSFLSNLLPGGKAPTNLRGVVLLVDITPFLGIPDPGRIGGLSRRIQERLRLVGETFGVHFPVYVVFTKADGIPYFADYFARLADNEDQQILGCTLPILTAAQRPAGEVFAESESARLAEAFNQLYYSLAEKRTTFLAREPVASRKIPSYEFPREMKRIRDTLVQFLVDVFRPNPLQPSPILRGYYFTGTRQVAASAASAGGIQAVQRGPNTGEATSLFNLQEYQKKIGMAAPETPQGEPTITRWAFVPELFHRVILADRLDAVAGFRHRKRDLYRRIVFGCVTFLGLLLSFCFLRSWWGNSSLLSDVRTAAQAPYRFQPAPGAVPSLDDLRAMEGLRQQLETLENYDRQGPPWRLRWFLYSGGRVLPDTYHLYYQHFRAMFFNDFYGKLAAGLGALPTTSDGSVSYDTAYSEVRAYRMVTSCKCKPDKTFLSPLFFNLWSSGKGIDSERQSLIQRQLDFYADDLAYKNPYNLDEKEELVDRGRQYLATTQGVDQIYHGLIEEVNRAVPPARIADFYPDFKRVLTGPGEVPGAFTLAGWKAVEKAIREGSKGPRGDVCVVGASAAVAQFIPGGGTSSADLEDRYWRDYIQHWEDFARQTKVAPFASAGDAAQKLSILADTRSPLLAAVFLISKNSNFPAAPAAAAAGGNAMGRADGVARAAQSGGFFSSLTSKFVQGERKAKALKKMKGAAEGPGSAKAPAATAADVARIFQPAQTVELPTVTNRLIDAPNQSYVSSLQSMQQAMDNLKDDRASNPNMSLHEAAKGASQAGQKTVSDMAGKFNISGTDGMDSVLKDFLIAPFNLAMRFVITDAGKVGRDKATAAGKSFCAALSKLQRKFPFDRSSRTDASPDEFASIFAPQNSAYATLQQALGKSLVKQGKFWANAPDADPKLSGDFLRFLNRIAAVSDAFFPASANGQARMQYALKIEPAPKVQGFTLTVDGETATTTGTSAQAKTFTWPGNGQGARLRVMVGASVPFGDYTGTWAVFRLLDNADPRPPGSKVAVLSKIRGQGASQAAAVTDSDGNPIVVKIDIVESPGGTDIFDPNFFVLRCPGRVTE